VVAVGGVVAVLVVGWAAPASCSEALGGVAGVVEVSVVTGVPAPSATLASGPPRPAAVRPPPATESSVRSERLRALIRGGICSVRSSVGYLVMVVSAASPHARDTPTRIHIGRQAGIRKGFVIGLKNIGRAVLIGSSAPGP
jgi:hypothetical protein